MLHNTAGQNVSFGEREKKSNKCLICDSALIASRAAVWSNTRGCYAHTAADLAVGFFLFFLTVLGVSHPVWGNYQSEEWYRWLLEWRQSDKDKHATPQFKRADCGFLSDDNKHYSLECQSASPHLWMRWVSLSFCCVVCFFLANSKIFPRFLSHCDKWKTHNTMATKQKPQWFLWSHREPHIS